MFGRHELIIAGPANKVGTVFAPSLFCSDFRDTGILQLVVGHLLRVARRGDGTEHQSVAVLLWSKHVYCCTCSSSVCAGCMLWVLQELCQSCVHYRNDMVRQGVSYDTVMAISTAPDPQGSGRVDVLTHPYTTAARATGLATGTADRDSSRWR